MGFKALAYGNAGVQRTPTFPIHIIDSNHVENCPFIVAAISVLSRNYAQLFSDSKMRSGGRKSDSSYAKGHRLACGNGLLICKIMRLSTFVLSVSNTPAC